MIFLCAKGYVRLISVDVIKECKKDLIDVILENGWNIENISREQCQQCLRDVDPLLLEQALESLGQMSSQKADAWCLDQLKVAACTADFIMWKASKGGKKKVCGYVMGFLFF